MLFSRAFDTLAFRDYLIATTKRRLVISDSLVWTVFLLQRSFIKLLRTERWLHNCETGWGHPSGVPVTALETRRW